VAILFSSFEEETPFMESGYIIIAASAIAVTAIYFLCVRKLGPQDKQPQAARGAGETP
jgi:hypothetical protein